jgi:hypothetical protein
VKNPRSFAFNLAVLLGLAALGLWLGMMARQKRDEPVKDGQDRRPPVDAKAASNGEKVADHSPEAVLTRILDRLRGGPVSAGELAMFRRAILGADPAQSVPAILRFLATGQDARTGESFSIGKNGELVGAPTLRVLLMDLLGRICKEHGGTEAGVQARALLEKKTSADEWSLALRNAAWANPKDKAYLAAKARELLDYQPWRQQPSAGYYEAFDVIVYTGDTSFITQLSDFVRGEDKPLKNTAASTLDRLSAMAPLEVMGYLNTHPAELGDKPFLRSDYYAKADFTQSAQRAAVETYLDRADVEARAKAKLIAALGNPGVFVSDNLLTSAPAPAEEIPPLQKAALARAVNDWISSHRFPGLTPHLLGKQAALAE